MKIQQAGGFKMSYDSLLVFVGFLSIRRASNEARRRLGGKVTTT